MNRTEILRSLPEPREPETVSFGQVVAVSNIFFVGGIDILCIDLFYRGELGVRYLSDRKTRNVWDARTNRWSTVKLENAALKMQGNRTNNPYSYYYAGHETYVWDTGKDEERTEEYLRQNIYYWEESMDARKRVQAEQRKQNRLNEKMDVVPAIPEGVEKWILDMLIPENYLFVHRDENACSCTSCGGLSVPDPKWKNRQQGSCPVCGNTAMVWIGKEKANEKKNIIVLQSYKDYYEDKKLKVKVEKEMWAERQFTAEVFWPWGDKKYVNCYEQLRALIPKGKTYGDLFFGIHDNAEEFEQEFSEKNVRNQQFRESYLYPGNLQEMLPYGHLEHSGMRELAEAGQRFNVNHMILNFETYPWIEYIIKAGLLNLAAEKIGMSWGNMDIDTSERKLTAALGIDGNRLNRLKRMNGGYVALEWLRWEQEQENAGHPVRVTEESLMILKRKKVAPRECVDILRELKSVNRMANYLKKQRQTGYNTIALWRDYLQMAAMEGMDVQDDIVRFPKNLKERHDQLVEIRNARVEKKRYEKLNAEIRKHLPEVRRMFWETPEYMFIPAGKCEELIQEGRTLHHCVGSSTTYMNRMAAGTSWIVFLRRKDNLEKPYYTLEVSMEPEKNNQIIQWYSEYDRKPDKQIIEKLLKRYKAFLDQGMRIQIAI